MEHLSSPHQDEPRQIPDPIGYYVRHYDGLTRGELRKIDPSLFQLLWRNGQLESIPKHTAFDQNQTLILQRACKRGKVPSATVEKMFQCFCADFPASDAAKLADVNHNTAYRYYTLFREASAYLRAHGDHSHSRRREGGGGLLPA
jgi:hypothetical protein